MCCVATESCNEKMNANNLSGIQQQRWNIPGRGAMGRKMLLTQNTVKVCQPKNVCFRASMTSTPHENYIEKTSLQSTQRTVSKSLLDRGNSHLMTSKHTLPPERVFHTAANQPEKGKKVRHKDAFYDPSIITSHRHKAFCFINSPS